MEAAELGTRAFEQTTALVQGVGPRPAGTAAEGRAREYVGTALRKFGYAPQPSPVKFAPHVRFFPLYPVAGLLLGISSWLVVSLPWPVLLLPFLGVSLSEITRWAVQRRPRTADSENLVAFLGEQGKNPTLILCAHLDSARASGFRGDLGLGLQRNWLFIFQRAAFLLALVAVLTLIELPVPPTFVLLIRVIGSLTGIWLFLSDTWRQLGRPGAYSPGAVDNASGVGLLLALAEAYAQSPPAGIRLGFLFTGAEETGMHGARAYAVELAAGQETDVFVLNVDMVGAGDTLRVVTTDGIFGNRRTDARLNRLLFESAPQAQGLKTVHRSGDFARFIEAGIPAASIEVSGSRAAARAYHTVFDDLSLLDQASLAMAAEAMVKFVRGFEAGLKNGEGF